MRQQLLLLASLAIASVLPAAEPSAPDTTFGDALLREYFRQETSRLTENCLSQVATLEDWKAYQPVARRQLFDMLGLDPLPERTPLQPQVTGTIEADEFIVERLHFQSRPGLYVTGNLYRPRDIATPLPAILYVCGHGGQRDKERNISFGNKTSYQHHGEWFARNGYICLTIDTIQLGEIEGLHHGTYREGMWWWHSHGYTPAGVEAWNCIRALDYLETRPEVDAGRIGVTGRSGGGAYSWWIAALDERIKAAVPVAGITSLQNHVVDNCIEGHCDCMYMVNSYRWDFPLLAALVAPRPLLISNTDTDRIFPLDGVYDVYTKTRRIYELHKAGEKIGFHITQGPHKDTQELRVHAFVWFDRYLKGESRELNSAAPKLLQPAELRVFEKLPKDERVTSVQEWFIPLAELPDVPGDGKSWAELRDGWLRRLKRQSLDEAPAAPAPCEAIDSWTRDGVRLSRFRLYTDGVFPLEYYLARPEGESPSQIELRVLRQQDWEDLIPMLRAGFPDLFTRQWPTGVDTAGWEDLKERLASGRQAIAWFAPRGVGGTEWSRDSRARTHILRRFSLLGKTADELQTYDVVQAARAIRGLPGEPADLSAAKLILQGRGIAAGWALFAAILQPDIEGLALEELPGSLDEGPHYLMARRVLDLPQAVALAAERTQVTIGPGEQGEAVAAFARSTAASLGWGQDRITVVTP